MRGGEGIDNYMYEKHIVPILNVITKKKVTNISLKWVKSRTALNSTVFFIVVGFATNFKHIENEITC